ncbi:hypothetical protein [Deinococcus sp.]|uniref:hypothetical protein n=1 Tax=Deinococcus sp. TaxID=47478 RepID=UPI003C7E3C40
MQLHLTEDAWAALQASLYEHDDRLERREDGQTYTPDERVDVWVLSAHAEAMYSQDIDPEVWDTLADLEMEAESEEDAWRLIRDFYLERGNVLVSIGDGAGEDREEWIFSEGLTTRLKIASFAS